MEARCASFCSLYARGIEVPLVPTTGPWRDKNLTRFNPSLAGCLLSLLRKIRRRASCLTGPHRPGGRPVLSGFPCRLTLLPLHVCVRLTGRPAWRSSISEESSKTRGKTSTNWCRRTGWKRTRNSLNRTATRARGGRFRASSGVFGSEVERGHGPPRLAI